MHRTVNFLIFVTLTFSGLVLEAVATHIFTFCTW